MSNSQIKPKVGTRQGHILPRVLARLRRKKRWVVWRLDEKGKKPPLQALRPNIYAKVNDPETWASYDDAVAAVTAGHADGIGYVIDNEIAAIDLDNCRDPATGRLDPWAKDIVDRSGGTYC